MIRNWQKRYTSDDQKLLAGGRDLMDYVEPWTDENGEARYQCDYGQGYYFSKPLPTEEFEVLLNGTMDISR